jgi:hypothetical protein
MQMPGAGAAPMGGMGQIGGQLGSQAASIWSGWSGPVWGGWNGPFWSGWNGWGDPWIVAQGPGEQFGGPGQMGGSGQMMRQAMPMMPQQAGQLASQQIPNLWGWGGPIWGGWGGPQWGGWGGWGDPWIVAQGPGEQFRGQRPIGGPGPMGGFGMMR